MRWSVENIGQINWLTKSQRKSEPENDMEAISQEWHEKLIMMG